MTERCQTKFTERINNQNYIVYGAIIVASLAVLYFYRFHFATIAISYVLGCLFCYYGLNSSILINYLEVLKTHYQSNDPETESKDVLAKGCVTCGSKECIRHDGGASSEPWAGLQVHKQLDQAIEEFYNTILDQFINSWYNKITLQPFFVDELRHQLRYASACLLQRAVKINYSRFITERLLPCALRHYTLCADSTHARPTDGKMAVHPAAANRTAELKYLRCVTNAVMPYLLRGRDLHNSVFRILVREIFAGWVLLSLTDLLADPYVLNSLIVLATDDEPMPPLPTSPDYTVEFLETFARQSDSVYTARCKLLKLELEWVLGEQEYLYAFMQFLKNTRDIHLLQFYKDIKSFQTKILNPELSAQETASLLSEAWDIYNTYFEPDSPSCVPLDPSLGAEMKGLLNGPDSIKRLQTSRALYQAARQSHAALAKSMLPRFLHSEEFYKVVVGSRIPIGYQKQMAKKQHDSPAITVLKLSKLKGALKTQMLDGQILDNVSNCSAEDCDSVDQIDVVKYLGNLASEESLREQDLSTYKVVLTNIETQLQPPPRRGPVRVLTLAVHRAAPAPAFWSVCRSEHDFHLLRSKMHEFHGHLLQDLPLPSRRDNSPLETLRYKYEDFIQRLLQKSLLQSSELLHLFLTVDSDFALVVQASSLSANSTDLTNIYQSMAHKLRKEKGQHLEGFLSNYLITTDMDRFQLFKPQIEEAQEVNEDIPLFSSLNHQPRRPRDISSSTFENNFDAEPVVFIQRENRHQEAVRGFTQCFMYLLLKIIKPGALVTNVVGAILSVSRHLADALCDSALRRALRWLSHRRIAAVVRLTHYLLRDWYMMGGQRVRSPHYQKLRARDIHIRDIRRGQPDRSAMDRPRPGGTAFMITVSPTPALLFTPRRPPRPASAARALARLLRAPAALPGCARALRAAHATMQRAAENKQLVYNLLDLCLMELFPELGTTDGDRKEPKS